MSAKHRQRQKHWTGLKLQGKLACMSSVDHSVSHTTLQNTFIDEDVQIFTVKAGLQVLPTQLTLSIWYRDSHSVFAMDKIRS